jgi:hypothetical protein
VRVDWATPCRYAEVHDNLATIVGGGIDHLWPPSLPAPIGVFMAIRLIFLPEEVAGQGQFQLRVAAMAPDGSLLNQVEGQINIGGPRVVPDPTEFQGLHVPMAVQFMAQTEGRYQLDITVDGHTYSVGLHVAAGPPPAPASLPPQAE